MADLKGRVAVVTGGGQGIGRGVALALASAGASLVIAGRTESTIEDTCRAARSRGVDAVPSYAAVEWGGDGIRALVVMPAAESDGVRAFRARDPERYAEMVGRVPMGRFGDPETDIGTAVAWLVSDEARYITGSTVMLDGGQMFTR